MRAVGSVAAEGDEALAVVHAMLGEEERHPPALPENHGGDRAEGGGRCVHDTRKLCGVVERSEVPVDRAGQIDGLVGRQLAVERMRPESVPEELPGPTIAHSQLEAVPLGI